MSSIHAPPAALPELDAEQCHAALRSHDARFDGLFFVGVTSTGIYCRPVCRVRVPQPRNCRYFAHAAAAESAGFRPCLRCRPELAPGLAPMDAVPRLARRAAQRIQAGALNDGTLDALATECGVSTRHLRRAVEEAYGVSPIALAQTHRLLLAKQLLTDTDLQGHRQSRSPAALAACAASTTPSARTTAWRPRPCGAAPPKTRAPAGTLAQPTAPSTAGALAGSPTDAITLRLGYRAPLAWGPLATFLASRGAPRVQACIQEDSDDSLDAAGVHYACTVALDGHTGWIDARPDPRGTPTLHVRVSTTLLPVLVPLQPPPARAVRPGPARPDLIDAQLARDPALHTSVRATPGLRVPGTLDTFDLALRAVLGQQVSVRAASTLVRALRRGVWRRGAHALARAGPHAPPPPRALRKPRCRTCARWACRPPARTPCTCWRSALPTALPPSPARTALAQLLALPGIGPLDGALHRPARAARPRRAARRRPRSVQGPGHTQRQGRGSACPCLATLARLRHLSPVATTRRHLTVTHPTSDGFTAAPAMTTPPDPAIQVTHQVTHWDCLPSPVGELLLLGDHDALTAIHFAPQGGGPHAVPPGARRGHPVLAEARRQLQAYLDGTLTTFDVPLRPAGTAFQQRVWAALLRVPYGATASYRDIAQAIDSPQAMRAVGLANGRNPIPLIVPCHRVIGSNGSLTGYAGGLPRKQWLLQLEAKHTPWRLKA